MGNKIYTICGADPTKESEIKSVGHVINSAKSEEKKVEEFSVRTSPALNLPFKVLHDLTEEEMLLLKDFDENITSHGHWISPLEMNSYFNENVRKVEMLIGSYEMPAEVAIKMQGAFEAGPFLFKDKTIYCGQWSVHGKKQGYGIYIKPDGSKYEGLWNNDKIEGLGRYIDKNGNYYEGNYYLILGNWKNGMANGQGTLVVTQGSRYEGNWINDFQEGYGKETFPDGTAYKGEYRNGHKHGEGEFTWSDGSVYTGQFENSAISGKGILKWKDLRQYSGQWLHNKMHGKGVFDWPDGKRYEGDYVNDKKEGEGIYYWSRDKYYKGQWNNSKQHGEGMLVLNDKVLRGKFRHGKLIKKYDDNKENQASENDLSQKSPLNEIIVQGEQLKSFLEVEDHRHRMDAVHVGETKSPQML